LGAGLHHLPGWKTVGLGLIGKAPNAKLQAPSSKLQKSFKSQAPKGRLKTCEAANANDGGRTRFPGRFWALELGIFLELGAWSLELSASLRLKRRETDDQRVWDGWNPQPLLFAG
jgi:hypothetical protein